MSIVGPILYLSVSVATHAQDPDFQLDKLVINNTKTKAGQDFYNIFYSRWQWPQLNESFNLTIKEIPFRGISTRVQISLNDLLVYDAILQPRYDVLKQMATTAIANVNQRILLYNEILKQLEGEDVEGTGIF